MEELTTFELLDKYFINIPNPETLFKQSNDFALYLNAFEQMQKNDPIGICRINFNDDVWDLRPFFSDMTSELYKISFSRLPNDLKKIAKLSFIYRMMGPTKVSTLSGQTTIFSTLITRMLDAKIKSNWICFTTSDYINFIVSYCCTDGHKHAMLLSVFWIYKFLLVNCKMKLDIDLETLKKELSIYRKKQKLTSKKIPNIPQEYFVKIVEKCKFCMNNKKLPLNDRAIAAFMILLSQTGIRINDLLSIKTNCLKKYTVTTLNKDWYMLEYSSRKPTKAHKPLLKFQTIVTKLCKEAIDVLLDIKRKRKNDTGNFLFTFERRTVRTLKYPIYDAIWKRYYHLFMIKYLSDECSKDWKDIPIVKVYLNRIVRNGKKIYTIKNIHVPDSRQFRVHICTELYYMDCPIDWIMKFMGHLSEYMMAYYVRPKDNFQENYEYSKKIVSNIVNDDIAPIGINGEKIKIALQKFAQDKGINVYKNIDDLMDKLGDKFVVRAKTGGVCIKTSIIHCSEDRMTDKLLCAYNLCPNIFHFFWMLDETYANFETSKETYKYNLKNGFLLSAEKEKNKIVQICQTRLIPEIKQLDEFIKKQGIDEINAKYPQLNNILKNKEKIFQEAKQWIKNN